MRTHDLTLIAMFAALTAGLAFLPPIVIPVIPVPITIQSIAVMLCGGLLSIRNSVLALALFLLLVALGLPILSGGHGGLAVFLGPTAGYLLGFPVAAGIIATLIRYTPHLSFIKLFIYNLLGGVLVVYSFGIAWMYWQGDFALLTLIKGNLLFLPGGLLKSTLAAYVVVQVRRARPQLMVQQS